MKQRILRIAVVLFCLLVMCSTVAMASPIYVEDYYQTPTNLRWEGYDMKWDWDPDPNDHFECYVVELYYSRELPAGNDLKDDWSFVGTHYCWGQYTYAGLDDFGVALEDGAWYAFRVYVQGEGEERDEEGNLWYYTYVSDPSELSPAIQFVAADPLPAPTGLKWVGSNMVWDVAGDTSVLDYYEVRIIYPGCTDEEYTLTTWVYVDDSMTTAVAYFESGWLYYGEGDYYFKVRAVSNDTTRASNSEWVTVSVPLTYDGSEITPMDAPAAAWDGETMTWTASEYAAYYDVEVFWSENSTLELDEDGDPTEGVYADWFEITDGNTCEMDNYTLGNRGAGYYFFRVRTISSNVTKVGDSEWSALSEGCYLQEKVLTTPTDPVWNDGVAAWTWNGSTQEAACRWGYIVNLYYAATEDGEKTELAQFYQSGASCQTSDWKSYAEADGWYFFRIQTDTDDWSKYSNSEWSAMSAGYEYKLPERLAAPTNVAWNGTMASWQASAADEELIDYYWVDLYYYGADGTEDGRIIAGASAGTDETTALLSSDRFAKYGDGVYQFRVRVNSADTDAYSNSDWVWSEKLTITPADQTLAAPTNLRWDGITMMWDASANADYVAEYEVQYYAAGSTSYHQRSLQPGNFPSLSSWVIEEWGEEIYFRVRAVSGDVNQYVDSAWVECSETYTAPDALAAATDLSWSGTTMTWSWDGGDQADYLNYFYVGVYYSTTENGEAALLDEFYANSRRRQLTLDSWGEVAREDGWYSFTVQAYSNNWSQCPHSGWSEHSASFYYEPAEPLAGPTDVKWDGSMATWSPSADEAVQGFSGYQVQVYFDYGDGDLNRMYTSYVSYRSDGNYRWMVPSDCFYKAGEYELRVITESWDYIQRSNSAPVSGGYFTYTGASAQLAAPTGLKWDKTTMTWDVPEDGSVAGYEVKYFPAGDPDSGYWSEVLAGEFPTVNEWDIEELGSEINFQVRAISADANAYSDSEWSAICTETYTLPDPLPTPTDPAMDANGRLTWSWSGDEEVYYSVEMYYAAEEDGEWTNLARYGIWSQSLSLAVWSRYADVEGWYRFDISAEPLEGSSYRASEAVSLTYYYVPAEPLAAPTNVTWNGSMPVWSDTANDAEAVDYYDVLVYYLGTESAPLDEPEVVYETISSSTSAVLPSQAFQAYGAGLYVCKVRAYSANPLEYAHSDWAAGDEFVYTPPATTLTAPTGLKWNGTAAEWDMVTDGSVLYYSVEFYCSTNENWGIWWDIFIGDDFPALSEVAINNAGGDIYFKVKAVSANANEANDSAWAYVGAAYSAKLAVPEASVAANEDGKPVISWNAVDGAAKYEVWRSVNGGEYKRLILTVKLSCTHTGAAAGNTYEYKVRAVAADGTTRSEYSDVVKFVYEEEATLAVPEATVAANADGKPVIKWNAVDGAAKYEVWRSVNGGEYKRLILTVKLSCTHTGAAAGNTYEYKVRAVAADGTTMSEYSDVVKFVYEEEAALAAPEASVAANEDGKPVISWNAVDGAAKYEVWRSVNGGEYKRLILTVKLSCTHTGAAAGNTYEYKVRTVAADGTTMSEYSDVVKFVYET